MVSCTAQSCAKCLQVKEGILKPEESAKSPKNRSPFSRAILYLLLPLNAYAFEEDK